MAREPGLNPSSLIKNIPFPNQQWKVPVKQWLHELYEAKTARAPLTQPRKHGDPLSPTALAPDRCIRLSEDGSKIESVHAKEGFDAYPPPPCQFWNPGTPPGTVRSLSGSR